MCKLKQEIMIWTIAETLKSKDNSHTKNAGGKAREDLLEIFLQCGIRKIEFQSEDAYREKKNPILKLAGHVIVAREWKNIIANLKEGDVLVVQFPVVNHTLFLDRSIKSAKKRGVKICAFVHDLEILRMSNDMKNSWRSRWRMKKEELDELKEFDKIVVHNRFMKKHMVDRMRLDESKIVILELFDYLTPESFEPQKTAKNKNSCIIAGNLKKEKAGYVYHLPGNPDFELYGVNYEGGNDGNVHYHGSFLPDVLLDELEGGFGLVWDGDSAETCSGVWGDYLRYNNPHKTSLYLACGIPVIIWKEAALADYILKNNVGIAVSSLNEINSAISHITEDEYRVMKENAINISKELRNGENTKQALKNLELI